MQKRGAVSVDLMIMIGIGIIALVVMLVIFGGKAKIFDKTLDQTCGEMGGDNQAIDKKCDDSQPISRRASDTGPKQKCCVPIG
tara:strand:- start:188 stop:436 length:249 start_codon:yes stop_codon:yes gene_type:complete